MYIYIIIYIIVVYIYNYILNTRFFLHWQMAHRLI